MAGCKPGGRLMGEKPTMCGRRAGVAAVTLIAVLATLNAGASDAGASKPTVGRPPIPGKYVLSPRYGQGGTGPGSLVLKKNGHHGYTVVNIRIKLPKGCEEYAGKVARVIPALHPKRSVAHRVLENEVSWDVSGKKHFGRTGKGNVKVIIDGKTFPANIDLQFFRGIPAFKPVEGSIDLTKVNPECFFLNWQGHRTRKKRQPENGPGRSLRRVDGVGFFASASAARLPFKPGHYVGTTTQTCPPESENRGLCRAGTKLPVSFTLTRHKISHIRAVVIEHCEGEVKTFAYKMNYPRAQDIFVKGNRATIFAPNSLSRESAALTNDLLAGHVKGRSARGTLSSLLTINDEGELDPNGGHYCRFKGGWRASLSPKPRRATSSSTRLSPAHLSWTLPHVVGESQPISFSWQATGRLGWKHRLVVQRRVGTAHHWKSIKRLRGRRGSTQLPGLPLGRYRLRIADLVGRRRVIAKSVSGIGVFGQVSFTTLFNERHVGALATPTASFSYIRVWPVYDSRNLFRVSRNNCVAVHVEFVPHFRDDDGDGTLTIIQESRDPVSATVPFETVGSVDAELTPGQTWGVNATNSPNLSIGLAEPEYYINGYAICDSRKSFFS